MLDTLRKSSLIEPLRALRWQLKAVQRRRLRNREHRDLYLDDLPIVFGNAMAKSGSHLLAQYLEGIASISPFVFIAEHPVRTTTREGRLRSDRRVIKDLHRLLPGDIGWGYIPARDPFIQVLTRRDWISYFIYRDPRDKIISHIYFAMDIHPEHAMRDYYHSLPTFEDRIAATIEGVPGLIGSIEESYASYRAWFSAPGVVKVRFEDLIRERAKCLEKMVEPLFDRFLAHHIVMEELIEHLNNAMAPELSRTYRSGKTGGWRDHFTPRNVAQFKEVAGELLIEMGYAHDETWS
jgi:hypothetical protein